MEHCECMIARLEFAALTLMTGGWHTEQSKVAPSCCDDVDRDRGARFFREGQSVNSQR